ncbi:ArpA protein [Acinetobacter sp. TUM15071]|uniref:HalD/BesD family halogenase n=1 Tax=Acinetobacter TaxID=469 RepID=UPI00124C1C90|nr:ArpA protein [Acinetobacter sp. TUM15071]
MENLKQFIEDEISLHLEEKFMSNDEVFWAAQSFLRDGYLKVTNLIPDNIKELFYAEVRELLGKYAKRRDLHMESTGNTPRFMSNVRQVDIAEYGQVIPAVYHSESLIKFLGKLAKEEIIPNPWEFEKFIINNQHKVGDTHGFHWGDYPYSMIWIVEAPPLKYGGILECVPHTYWDKKNARIKEHLLRNPVKNYHHETGDIYLLKSDTTLHRVTPLEQDATRIIVNMAWERARDINREVTHETYAFRD